jgi:hypothetical protein
MFPEVAYLFVHFSFVLPDKMFSIFYLVSQMLNLYRKEGNLAGAFFFFLKIGQSFLGN